VVFAVTSTSCPLSRKYLPTLVELVDATLDDVAWLSVNPVTTDVIADMRAAEAPGCVLDKPEAAATPADPETGRAGKPPRAAAAQVPQGLPVSDARWANRSDTSWGDIASSNPSGMIEIGRKSAWAMSWAAMRTSAVFG
jgi:hypothetical protein